MSIAPLESFPPAKAVNPTVGSRRAQGSDSYAAQILAQPVSGTLPEQESSDGKTLSLTHELPQDVVEVHQDPDSKNQVIIEYLDKARNLILQVPSSEELNVERGIAQEIQQAATLRASAPTPASTPKGEETHGD
jgi:hypothetical protein